ncbi:MAG: chromosome segregation protein SMC, partial [SAR324 cluster bacterium]|nr:chromosome segregation protein SMC [SAR324 cluster bacterium]
LEKSKQRILEIDASFDQMLDKRELLKRELDEELELQERKNEEHHLQGQQLQEIRSKLEESNEALHQQSLKQTEFRMLREQLENQLAEISDRGPEELMKEIDTESLDQTALNRESRSLKARISSMGHVNLSAPEEYDALMERLGFLSSQSEDLQQATDDLKKTIRDINNESRRRFKEMFDLVNVKFKQVFQTLFEGGDASMVLTESEDLLDAGVDIVAQPPGKKLQNLNLLSGGEKALTAISLIFAIFLIKPSPFCLLDEVDAPLDDANVVRFNRLINSLTDNAQFIVITHNKKTMEIGDLLYGVTMENPGISKTVSVQFKEAQKLVA